MSDLGDRLAPKQYLVPPPRQKEVQIFIRDWKRAFDAPTDQLRKASGIITDREKYRTRAVGYVARFFHALLTEGTQPEIVDLAIEAGLLPTRDGDVSFAADFRQHVLAGEVSRGQLSPLRTAFRRFWGIERRKIARVNRRKRREDPDRYAKYVRKSRASPEVL